MTLYCLKHLHYLQSDFGAGKSYPDPDFDQSVGVGGFSHQLSPQQLPYHALIYFPVTFFVGYALVFRIQNI